MRNISEHAYTEASKKKLKTEPSLQFPTSKKKCIPAQCFASTKTSWKESISQRTRIKVYCPQHKRNHAFFVTLPLQHVPLAPIASRSSFREHLARTRFTPVLKRSQLNSDPLHNMRICGALIWLALVTMQQLKNALSRSALFFWTTYTSILQTNLLRFRALSLEISLFCLFFEIHAHASQWFTAGSLLHSPTSLLLEYLTGNLPV